MSGKQKFRKAKVEQELKKVEEEWANAYVRHDAEPLKWILADELAAELILRPVDEGGQSPNYCTGGPRFLSLIDCAKV